MLTPAQGTVLAFGLALFLLGLIATLVFWTGSNIYWTKESSNGIRFGIGTMFVGALFFIAFIFMRSI